jgi:hypothetical protein
MSKRGQPKLAKVYLWTPPLKSKVLLVHGKGRRTLKLGVLDRPMHESDSLVALSHAAMRPCSNLLDHYRATAF